MEDIMHVQSDDELINDIPGAELGQCLPKKSVFDSGKTVVGVKFEDYLEWISKDAKSSAFEEVLKLPSIQRGFVWKPAKIATLWDSLLRGMPIGSLLLNEMKANEWARDVAEKAPEKLVEIRNDEKVLGLLDGQQRTLAMKIGWPGAHQPADHCIWIDLLEDGQKGAPFELRITTKNQKFGFARHTHGRMGIADRRDASEAWLADSKELQSKGIEPNDSFIRPWKGQRGNRSLLIRLSELWSCYLGRADEGGKCFHGLMHVKEVIESPEHPQRKALVARLDRLALRLKHLVSSEIPLVKLVGLESTTLAPSDKPINAGDPPEDASNDPLILLFQRISTAGERLSFEDLLFSMIKRHWPQAHDLVEKIHKGKVQHLLTAPGYVMAAFRLSSIEYRKANPSEGKKFSDVPDPGDSTFYSRINFLLGTDESPSFLRAYVGTDNQDSPLAKAFELLYELIVFEKATNLNGIPVLMMPLLPHHLIHVLVYWVLKQGTNASSATLKHSSDQLIAFVLFWHLCVVDGARASSEALAYLENNPANQFPGIALYSKLVNPPANTDKNGSMRAIFTPQEIGSILDVGRKPKLRSMSDRRAIKPDENDPRFDPRFDLYNIFWNKHSALLWLQRGYLGEKFGGFIALAGKLDEETVPYDYDHICPKNEWRRIHDESHVLVDLWMRDLVGNSIGNFHLLDAPDNRGLGDASTAEKFSILEEAAIKEKCATGFFDRSAIAVVDRPLWESASPAGGGDKKYTWDQTRIGAFQEAVERRAIHLYSLYFNGMKCLLPPAQSVANPSTFSTTTSMNGQVSPPDPSINTTVGQN